MVEDITLRLVHGLVRALACVLANARAVAQDAASWLFMRWVETYPAPLEAVLGTEEAVLDAELQAGRALQGASIVVAIDAEALLLGRWFRSHDCREGSSAGARF